MLVEFTDDYREAYSAFRFKLDGKMSSSPNDPFDYYANKELSKNQLWILVEGEEIVGSVFSKLQKYVVEGKLCDVYFIKYPVTLAVVDKNYIHCPIQLILAIRKKFAYSFLLGMGGINSRTAKIFSKFGFLIHDIPFLLKPINYLSLFFNNPYSLRFFPFFSDLKIPKLLRRENDNGYEVREVDEFSLTAFDNRYDDASFSLLRNAKLINSQAPHYLEYFKKLSVLFEDFEVAHFTLFVSNCRAHKYFGNLKIGVLLDWVILDENPSVRKIFRELNNYLRSLGVDVIMANVGNSKHILGLKNNRWFSLKSNFAIGLSPKLANCISESRLLITRLDGDGPINLGVEL